MSKRSSRSSKAQPKPKAWCWSRISFHTIDGSEYPDLRAQRWVVMHRTQEGAEAVLVSILKLVDEDPNQVTPEMLETARCFPGRPYAYGPDDFAHFTETGGAIRFVGSGVTFQPVRIT